MRRLLFILLLALPLPADTTVTLIHFSDYHSHALPFYTDEGERGGIARAVRWLRDEKRKGALVFSGGDTINKGSPAWSDKYGCAEWPWLNGIVDAMAVGNHEIDYGPEAFELCRQSARYPILSANLGGFQRSAVFTANGVRVGVFALAGRDFEQLVKLPGFKPADPIETARQVVRELRENSGAEVVVMIGHQHAEDDYAMARAVGGIDVIFGSHSHLKRDLTRIPGTDTWFISPSQYLSYISRLEVTLDENDRVKSVRGALVPVDASMAEDRSVKRRAKRMQRELERDPEYRELFVPIARLDAPMKLDALARRTLEVMRSAAGADVALSTASSFRRPLPAGPITMELLRGALPYDNEIIVCSMTGAQLERVLDFSKSRAGTDSESYVSGPEAIDPTRTYRVATTDYLANVAYKDVFDCEKSKSGLRVREAFRSAVEQDDPSPGLRPPSPR